jgi:hypothetical protein
MTPPSIFTETGPPDVWIVHEQGQLCAKAIKGVPNKTKAKIPRRFAIVSADFIRFILIE